MRPIDPDVLRWRGLVVASVIAVTCAACQSARQAPPTTEFGASSTDPAAPGQSSGTTVMPWMEKPVNNSADVIQLQVRPRANRCYQHGLEGDPTQTGCIVLTMRVDERGMVGEVTVTSNGEMRADVADCITRVAHGVRFEPPGPKGATLKVSLNCAP